MFSFWSNWCRVCGCGHENGSSSSVDMFIKNDTGYNLSETFAKYFHVTLTKKEHLPSKICLLCIEKIISIIKFDEQTLKVQQMFFELEESLKLKLEVNLSSLLAKYSIDSEHNYFSNANYQTPQRRMSFEFQDVTENLETKEDPNTVNTSDNKSTTDSILKAEVIEDENDLCNPNNYTDGTTNDNHYNEQKNVMIVSDVLEIKMKSELDDPNKMKKKEEQSKKNEEYITDVDDIPEPAKHFECNKCKNHFASSKDRMLHIKNEHCTAIGLDDKITHLTSDQENALSCQQCDKKFANKRNIRDHIRIVHNREKLYVCETCGSAFGSKKTLIDHRLIHSEERNFQCAKCNKSFKTKQLLKAQSSKHKPVRIHQGRERRQQPQAQSSKHKPVRIHQGRERRQQPQIHADIHDDTEYICPVCGLHLNTKRILRRHMNVHSDIKKYKCKFCSKQFKWPDAFKRHEDTHLPDNERKTISCQQCDKKFFYERYLYKHIRMVHNRERPFVCEICGAAFGFKRNLINHHLTHSEEKKFQCTKCNKTFKCERALKLHIDIHDDTQYICPVCGVQLNTKRILQGHMVVHSDLSKYQCNFCSKQFKRSTDFKNHLILHTGIKPFQCPFCQITFANGSNCRKHQRTAHPAELAAAELTGKPKISINVPSIKQLIAINENVLTETKDLLE